LTLKEPETTPPAIVQFEPDATGVPVIVQFVSVGLKPNPETCTLAPIGPKLGESVTRRATMVNCADAVWFVGRL